MLERIPVEFNNEGVITVIIRTNGLSTLAAHHNLPEDLKSYQ